MQTLQWPPLPSPWAHIDASGSASYLPPLHPGVRQGEIHGHDRVRNKMWFPPARSLLWCELIGAAELWRWWQIRQQLLVEHRGCASLTRPERRRRHLSWLLTGVAVASSPVWDPAGGDDQLEMRRQGRGSGQRSCGSWRFATDQPRLIGWEIPNRPVLDGSDRMNTWSNG